MQRLLLPLVAAVSLSAPVLAGLGDADIPTKREFDAYCGKKGNDCKVVISPDSITVNGTDGITKSQIISFDTRKEFKNILHPLLYYTTINYKENGIQRSGTFIFVNTTRHNYFVNSLEWFCPDCNNTVVEKKL